MLMIPRELDSLLENWGERERNSASGYLLQLESNWNLTIPLEAVGFNSDSSGDSQLIHIDASLAQVDTRRLPVEFCSLHS